MKALVTVKEVTEVADDFEIGQNAIDEAYLNYGLNEWDDYAIEEAVQARESGIVEEVVAVTIGPERTEETIRMALAKGVDRAIRVWDDALASTDFLDVGAKTRVFEAIVEKEQPDIVLSGVQANDDAFGATGVSLASAAGYGWAAVVNALDVEPDEGVARVHRELEGGVEELSDVHLPAVFTIQTGINEPRYASLRGIRQAQSKEIDVLSLGNLGTEPEAVESNLELTAMYEPESESDATYFEGEPDEQATRLADLLREEGVVEA